jgi:hypothetical protein
MPPLLEERGKNSLTQICSPGSHPHSDQPNWRPAETIDDYLQNCREGLETYSDRRAAKLFGTSRAELWRWKLMAELPDDLVDYIFAESTKVDLKPSTKALAQIAIALRRGTNLAEVERCPHCGGTLRIRALVGDKLAEIVNRWLATR